MYINKKEQDLILSLLKAKYNHYIERFAECETEQDRDDLYNYIKDDYDLIVNLIDMIELELTKSEIKAIHA